MGILDVSVKRWFLDLAFFPNGGDITRSLGMVPASDDVEKREFEKLAVAVQRAYSTTLFDAAVCMARWYTEAAETAQEFGHSQRTLEEHLVSFLMAALAAGVVVPPEEDVNDG